MSSRPEPRRSQRTHVLAAAGAAGVAALAIAFALTTGDDSSEAPARAATPDASEEAAEGTEPRNEALASLARRETDDPLARGDADAPVVLINYSDFQCPFCGTFARQTEPVLTEEYVEEGVLRIEWRNMPIFGEESERAARASWAAGQQGLFWEFHDIAYAHERPRDQGEFSEENVEAMASEAGVPDLPRFLEDMHSDDARAALERDLTEGYGLGVNSTPAFLINGEPILGAQPTDVFEQVVRDAAQSAEAADR